ncbi:ABC transporter permease [Tissierella sp.]|uniref:ABC transporter permease n=1 Tax=Tissierella sp. TaxID=41274 RepID=UPI00304E3B61
MKNPISKSNLRRPLKGILLLIILLIASNLFISSISQFFIVNREIDNIGKHYRSIGTIRPLDENNSDVKEAQELITGDPMIDFEDNRRFTTGVIDGLYRNKRNGNMIDGIIGSNVLDTVFIGELKEVDKYTLADNIYEGTILRAKVTDILAGTPDLIESEFYYKEYQEHRFLFLSHSIDTGEKYEYIDNDIIDELFQLELGKKYLFRTDVFVKSNTGSVAKPLYDDGPLYIELDDNGYIDWDDPQFKIIKEEMEFINENIFSYYITGTKDMTAMQEVQDSAKDYYLVDGRWIDKEDDEIQNYAVIIHETIAKNYNINIGDKLEIKMRDNEYGASVLFTEKDHREWRNYYTSEPKSFEVVGIFNQNSFGSRYYYMYVPESIIPIELGRYTGGLDEPISVSIYSYSFVLKNAEDESAFIEKYKEPLKELGYELSFLINNIGSFKEASDPIKRSTAISAMVFSVLLILIQGFVIYVYIDGHKLNYAIERALGIPAKISGKHLVQPLVIFGIIASAVGGYTGYNKAIEKSTELLSSIPSNIQRTVTLGLDIKYFILFIFLSMIPFSIMLFLRIKQLKNSSVIDLINNNKKKKIVQVESKQEGSKSIEMVKATTISQSTENTVYVEERKEKYIEEDIPILTKDSQKALKRFSLNHTLRSKVTSILLIVLAGIFTFSLLWMNYLTIKNNGLIEKAYKDTIITGDIIVKQNKATSQGTGPIHRRHIDKLIETDLVKDYKAIASMIYEELYINRDGVIKKYEIGEKDKVHVFIKHPIFAVNASSKSYNSSDRIIEFADLTIIDGYSLEDFDKEYTRGYSKNGEKTVLDEKGEEDFPILVSKTAMDHYDLKLGDKILLEPASRHRQLSAKAYGTIVGTFKGISSGKDYYGKTIVNEEIELFIYPIRVLNITELQTFYSKIEFVFKQEKNKELMERKEEIKRIVSDNGFNEFPMELKLWDEELTNVMEPLEKNISLLEVLYPVTFILSIVIAGILAFIMVLRRSTDTAILRILGVKEKEVRLNLFSENLMLVLIGTAIACITVFAISIKSYPIDLVKYIVVTGGYMLGTTAGLILGIGKVTNKKPLEMLQVKE